MKKNLTELVFILDRSGSMSGLEADTVNGTFAVFQRVSGLKDGNLQFRAQPGQLIGGKDTAGPRADNDHIVIHDYLTMKDFAVNHLRRLVETLNQNRLRKSQGCPTDHWDFCAAKIPEPLRLWD